MTQPLNATRRIDVFSAATDTFLRSLEFPYERYEMGVAVVGPLVYFAGGFVNLNQQSENNRFSHFSLIILCQPFGSIFVTPFIN